MRIAKVFTHWRRCCIRLAPGPAANALPIAINQHRSFYSYPPYPPQPPVSDQSYLHYYMGSRVHSRRPVVDQPVHNLVGDTSQPGVNGSCGVKPVAARDVKAGEIVFQESGEITDIPSMHSMQVSETGHATLRGEGRFLSHSFKPNCKIRIDELSSHPIDLLAIRDIPEGETLSFNYCTTEWIMAVPFTDSETGRPTKGFKFLPEDEKLAALQANLLPAHILRIWLRDIYFNRSD